MNSVMKKVLVLVGVIVVLVLALVVVMGVWGDQLFDALPASARRARRLAWVAIPVLIAVFGATLRGPLMRWIMRDENATADSGIAVGRVVSLNRTALSVNDVPQQRLVLDVETPDGGRFRSQATQLIPEHELGAFEPGALLPVRYRPGRTRSVSLIADSSDAAQAALNDYLVGKGLITPQDLDVARRGVRTSAVVTAATPTGQVRDGHTQLQLDVLVARPDGSQYPVTQRLFVPASQLSRVHVGSRVATFVLPEDEQRVSVGLAV
ncbi:hypothetical protein [Occultella gossypii]|uniref:Uncharacterized protein n=1 Tax=Occultella gossypii TaxID=2800820 RepID=A0ABS7S838_9MICO|nr:hypothetical protein [Occultella gossypii]MBZ2196519.1 hypothetical protein [Occultella gossypii]